MSYPSESLTFSELRRVNEDRAKTWHQGGLSEWSLNDWGIAMVGEAGEVAGALKKLKRLRDQIASNNNPVTEEVALQNLWTEIGDTLVYLDLLATVSGTTLEKCVVETFNRISVRENLPHRL
jgi:NTP pyrophosphatase (non-canonical NTP hydrolase)